MTLSEKSWTLALFVASVISSSWWPTMPDWRWLLLGVIATGLITQLRRGLISIGVIWGILVVIVHGNIMEYQRQALFQAGKNITITGKVDSPFKQISHGYEGLAEVDGVNSQNLLPFVKPKIRLITPFPLLVNSTFTTQVSLKPIFGLRNEAGFDAEQQAIGNGIVARATVSSEAQWMIRVSPSIRQNIIHSVTDEIAHLNHFPLINALAFSDRSLLIVKDWRELRDSGLLHLVSISGLHIGMAFAFGVGVGFVLRYGLPRFYLLPPCIGLLTAIAYAWLADFSLPTTRAVSVCAIYVVLKFSLVYWSAWRVLLLAVALQLFIEPFASLSMSFWLSYLSVAAVLLAVNVIEHKRGGWSSKLMSLFTVQLVLTCLIIPISGYFFSGTSLVSIIYNLVFIPWFGFVIVPLMFLALGASMLTLSISGFLWQWLDWALWPLSWSIQFAAGGWQFLSIEATLLVTAISLCLLLKRLLVTPAFFVVISVVMSVAVFYEREDGHWRIDVLDVGHGLAVLIEKDGEVMLYDTGKSWGTGSIAEQVITPILHRRGFDSIDTFIISHADSDHAGGRLIIEALFSPIHKVSSQNYADYQPCVVGENWQWQELKVEVLWPPKRVNRAYNPHSCVIRLTDPHTNFRLLLTGDIEAISEWMLIRQPNLLVSDVMLVPHHGSKSSSISEFVKVAQPKLAIASLAKSNQWGMPAESVKSAYQEVNADWLDTGEKGQVSVFIRQDNWYFETKRSETFEPWYRQMLRKGVE
ncbi:DNA internalization-related competence protein ComEC/Rec2 [Vibrio alfacsensis]|uniref:DNA internalization-related competence protein ComEC/Rec2 n=1 Tax=Vibrio alfacsensis TaxID=1074311 RepID=UPI004068892B